MLPYVSPRGERQLHIVYLCAHEGGEPTPDGAETDAARFLTLQELEALAPGVNTYCYNIARSVLRGEHRCLMAREYGPYGGRVGYQ